MASIKLKGVFKTYPGGVTAVHDFNLDIEDREFVIFVGPSGCGKSTTLRMIAGLEEISEGEIYIDNVLVNDISPKDRNIAMVFQTYALYPHKTVYKNMSFSLELQKLPKEEIDRRVRQAAQALDITEYLSRKPKALSGGQRQRVALGRAMVRNPSVFLLDEPLSNLDAKLRSSMRAQIKKLHNRLQATFVYVTHDQTEAMTMGDRIVVMKDGFIQQVDTPQMLYDRPANIFVAGFIGTPQMNFLSGTVISEGGGYKLKLGDTLVELSPEKVPASLGELVGREVVLGIRPEDLCISDCEGLRAEVEVTELMGNETYVHMLYGSQRLISRVSADSSFTPGQEVSVRLRSDKIHLFDKQSSERIV